MKSERMARQDLRFDASLGADENDLMTCIRRYTRQRQRGHEMAAGAAAGD